MSKQSRTATCEACGWTGPRGKNGLFHQSHVCPSIGANAETPDHKGCPIHGDLVWTVGPYSAYRVCGGAGKACTAKGGKPWRYFASKGGDESPAVPLPVTPSPAPSIPPAPASIPEAPQASTPIPAPAPSKAPAPVTTSASDTPALSLKGLGSLGDMIQSYVDTRATELATEIALRAVSELGSAGPVAVNWSVNGQPFAAVEGAHHKALPRILKLYAAGFRNFLIVGPAGSGKTTLAHNLATALKTTFAHVSCTAGMSESKLVGKGIPNLSTGETRYAGTPFVKTYESGGVFLLDEVDAADANVMLAINSALANGHMSIPDREDSPEATRHPASVIICAANTWGTGADRQYVGRNQLDAAFLDRFVGATIEVDYDRDLESAIVGDAHVCARVWSVREKASDLKLRRTVGTRFLMAVARLVKGAGETMDAALTACTTGWTNDERSKLGIRGAQ